MKEFLLLAALAAHSTSQPVTSHQMTPRPDAQQLTAWICFSTGEQVAGDNKICYYDCNGSAAAITVGWAQLCPMSINR